MNNLRKILSIVALCSCMVALSTGSMIATNASPSTPLGMHEPSILVSQQHSETTTNLYVIMYISSGITLASMALALSIFVRSAQSIDKLTDNLHEIIVAEGHTNSKVEGLTQAIGNLNGHLAQKPCLIERADFWKSMEKVFDVRQQGS